MLKSKTSQTGAIGEEIACTFLERNGYRIIGRNYRQPWGEIDIIAEKGSIVHFVEVKSSSQSESASGDGSREMGYRPEEMATEHKIHKVARTAALYMESTGDSREYQIDVVGVLMDTEHRRARCRFFEQVIE